KGQPLTALFRRVPSAFVLGKAGSVWSAPTPPPGVPLPSAPRHRGAAGVGPRLGPPPRKPSPSMARTQQRYGKFRGARGNRSRASSGDAKPRRTSQAKPTPIALPPMPDPQDQHDPLIIADRGDDPVIAHADAIEIVLAIELDRSPGPGVGGERL